LGLDGQSTASSSGDGVAVQLGGGDFSRTDSADETESVEMSTGFASIAVPDVPSTSSDVVPPEAGTGSFDGGDSGGWVVSVSSEVMEAAEQWEGVVEILSETAGTPDVWTGGAALSTEDFETGSSGTTTTSEEDVLASSRLAVDFLPGFSTSAAAALFVALLLVRVDAPDDVVLVIFDVAEATAKQVWAPAEPAGERVVV